MTYDINASLERLEQNLQNVDSAREQVEKTITSSNSLQASVAKYVESLNILQEEVRNLIADIGNYKTIKTSEIESAIIKIQASCEAIVTSFNEQIDSSSADFEAKMNHTLIAFGRENSKLAELVSHLNALSVSLKDATDKVLKIQEKLDDLSEDLKKSQLEQDNSLDAIKSSLESLPVSVKKHIDEVVETLNTNNAVLKTATDSIMLQTRGIISAQSELKSLCNSIKSDIKELRESVDYSLSGIHKGININRWIILIGILFAILLHLMKL